MDIEAFSDDTFDAVSWINITYKNVDQETSKEAFVTSLVSKLQLYVQQVSSALEDTSQQIIINLPKVMKEAQNLQSDVLLLRTKMNEIQNEIKQVQNETGKCMTNLERLDALKTKLELAKHGLQESDGWGKLISELEDLFERNDLLKICEKLNTLQKSLIAQEGLSGQSDRKNQVEGFKNRLEALASPSVVQCFSVGDIEQSKKYVTMFKDMNRLSQLTQYYRTVQKTALQQHWTEIIDLSDNSNHFLQEYYEFLFENYQKQSKWCVKVFGLDLQNEAVVVIIELLSSLQPSRESQILNALKRSNDKLDVLLEFSEANVHFANLLQKHFQTGEKPSKEQFKLLSSVIFDYFNTFITQYPTIEQNFLATNLTSLNLTQSTAAETVRILGNANKKILQWVDDAWKRCNKITQNCAIAPLVLVINSNFKTFIEKYKRAQQQLHASRNIEQNWSLLQSCISLLQNLGEFQNAIEDFEKRFAVEILQTNERLNQVNDEYLGYKLIERRDINELRKICTRIKESQQNNLQSDNNEIGLGLFSTLFEMIKLICCETHDTTLTVVFSSIEKQLNNVEPPEIINASGTDLPNCSFAPQEFITEIGQYLLTLPQHLEPLLLSPTPSLKIALEYCDKKYTKNIPSADVFLSIIVEEFCTVYQSQILQIKSLNNSASRQIATDIEYIGSVLEELGLNLSNQLQQITTLLKASPENYLSMSNGCEPRLVTAIRQMRNIISTELK